MQAPLHGWRIGLALLLTGCLPAYDNHYSPVSAPDLAGVDFAGVDLTGVDMAMCPIASGKVVTGRNYSWGPAMDTAGFKSGVTGNVWGFDCLPGMATTDMNMQFAVPIPQPIAGDGMPHFLEWRGTVSGTPVLHTVSGPLLLDGGFDNMNLVRHVILDQTGNMRDTIGDALGIKLGTDHSWIWGVFYDSNEVYAGEKVTVTAPPAATAGCKVSYVAGEFRMGVSTGTNFLDKTATSADVGQVVVTCDQTVSGMITLHAEGGVGLSDGFPPNPPFADVVMPINTGNIAMGDAVLIEWNPPQ